MLGELVRLASVAGDAGGDDIVPTSATAFVAGDDVIEIEFLRFETILAVLAAVGIAAVNVFPGELDLLLGKAIEEREDDDLGHEELVGDRSHDGFLRR